MEFSRVSVNPMALFSIVQNKSCSEILSGKVVVSLMCSNEYIERVSASIETPSLFFKVFKSGFLSSSVVAQCSQKIEPGYSKSLMFHYSGWRCLDDKRNNPADQSLIFRNKMFRGKVSIDTMIAAYYFFGEELSLESYQSETEAPDFGFRNIEKFEKFIKLTSGIVTLGRYEDIAEADELWRNHGSGPPIRKRPDTKELISLYERDEILRKEEDKERSRAHREAVKNGVYRLPCG